MPGHPSLPASHLLQRRYRLGGEHPPGRFPAALRREGLRQEARRARRPPHRLGVAIVGGGPAGMACAVRLGQLLGEDPATMETLGEVPLIVLEKGRAPGSHALSGAIVNPSALRELFPDLPLDQLPTYGPVTGEAVYLMTKGRAQRLPTPPPFHNKGNWIFSLSRLTRWMGERAEELGAFVQPDDRPCACWWRRAPCAACRPRRWASTAPATPRPAPRRRPRSSRRRRCWRRARRVTCAASRSTISRSVSRFPQTYEIGVKEIWKVPKRLDRIVRTLGWPLRGRASLRRGRRVVHPMGPDHICIGFVAGLEYADSGLSPHDLLQAFKAHPYIRRGPGGRRARRLGREGDPRRRLQLDPEALVLPVRSAGDSAGLVDMARLKGVHMAMHSGHLAAETIFTRLQAGADLAEPGALAAYEAACEESVIRQERCRPCRRTSRLIAVARAAVGSRPRRPRLISPAASLPPGSGRGVQRDDAEVEVPEKPLKDAGPSSPTGSTHVRQALVGLPLRQPDPRRPPEPSFSKRRNVIRRLLEAEADHTPVREPPSGCTRKEVVRSLLSSCSSAQTIRR